MDEAGFIADLGYVTKSVLFPMLKTTRGKLIVASTPPPTPAHDFVGLTREAGRVEADHLRTSRLSRRARITDRG